MKTIAAILTAALTALAGCAEVQQNKPDTNVSKEKVMLADNPLEKVYHDIMSSQQFDGVDYCAQRNSNPRYDAICSFIENYERNNECKDPLVRCDCSKLRCF